MNLFQKLLPWLRHRDTDVHESRAAVAESTRRLEEASVLQGQVKRVTDSLAGGEDLFRVRLEQVFRGRQ